jgi:hypothetical protein
MLSGWAEPPTLEPQYSPPLFAPRSPRLVARAAGSLAASGDGRPREALKRSAPGFVPPLQAVNYTKTQRKKEC